MKKILLIQTAFIGDVILATPVIIELNRIFPDSKIDFLVRKGNESLLDNNPYIHEVLIFDKKKQKLKKIVKLIRQIRSNKYDLVINLQRFASSGMITAFSGAKLKIGFEKNPFSFLFTKKIKHEIGNGLHEVERNLLTIQEFGAKKMIKPQIFLSDENYAKVENYKTGNYYCLAPASIWFTKQLPVLKWIELAEKLCLSGKVYLMGGPNDFELCEQIKNELKLGACDNLAGKLSFLDSAALFQDAKMNYVNDSGPMHFCSAVNAPVTVFFCSTSPEFGFGPLSDNAKIVESEIKPSCKPCGLHGFKACPKGNFLCGNEIKIDIVF
jgi:ADP-heptose:LPS heptosyltransferase